MRNIASRLSPRRAMKRTDSLANLTPPRRAAPTPASVHGLQPPAAPALFRGLAPALQGPPRPLLGPSTPSAVEGPSPIPPTLCLPTVVLGTPIPQTPIPQGTLPTPPVVLGTPIPQESFPTTPSLLPQGHRRGRYTRQSAHAEERQFDQIVDPPFIGDLNLPALSEEDQALVREFYTALNDDQMHSCIRCREHWFDMKRNSLKICSRCISRDRERTPNEPYFFSAANNLDFGEVPGNLPGLIMVEEMLIARVHVHVKVLQRHHPGYRDIVVPQGPVEEAVEEDPSDVDASAIPNLQVTDTELNALQSRFLHGTPDPERMADLEHMPPSAQA
ncbi:uncharacterized protein NECHADRAFT_88634 [Fusarium vanettenii 77-13-4]|uniref:DUF6570 domain-containing protein n=1 Tax=Fusarium vanettenii (strain ATCC MYA-4622 / CBS 123669 / FGSC 9596 / NRRL 45880 / 77-13-4) TaxID=660122 RepID=C7ZC22_FUSV7|nr:uncharacterized protein NECHADRAFT_88634 [Fusarium vanettenii 77-13-4]EEU38460.1 hypothetical protein NECHADRAFT_88634 [Fusarium vanettenii 77-13-4]